MVDYSIVSLLTNTRRHQHGPSLQEERVKQILSKLFRINSKFCKWQGVREMVDIYFIYGNLFNFAVGMLPCSFTFWAYSHKKRTQVLVNKSPVIKLVELSDTL